jgi:hypothetical protein
MASAIGFLRTSLKFEKGGSVHGIDIYKLLISIPYGNAVLR